jgi:hypothetical protein
MLIVSASQGAEVGGSQSEASLKYKNLSEEQTKAKRLGWRSGLLKC